VPPRTTTSRAGADSGPTADHRIVLLHGPEAFLREEGTRSLIGALEQKFGEIEIFRFDGQTISAADVLDELRSYGLIQRHKLVILDFADQFLAAKDEDEEETEAPKEKARGAKPSKVRTNRELLGEYADRPVPDATLLLRAETWRPGNLDKKIAAIGWIAKCEAIDASAAAAWCVARAQHDHQAKLARDAASLLVERLGSDLVRLDTELAKLATFVGAGAAIDVAAVRELVGPSREEEAWAIQSAILAGSPSRALRTLHEIVALARTQSSQEVLVAWSISDLLRKLHAAARLLRQRVPPASIRSQLRLFGPGSDRLIDVASRRPPSHYAELLHEALESDRRTKSGLGRAERNLEVLTVRVADTLREPG